MTRLRIVPVPADETSYLLVIDKATPAFAEGFPGHDARKSFAGCAGILVSLEEVEVV